MPVYEYECSACSHRFEEWQKMSDEPVRTCPKCKKKKVERLISQTSFQLKGGGWYSDLYSSSKGGKTESGGGGGTETKSEKKEAKAETKPAASDKKKGSGGSKTATA